VSLTFRNDKDNPVTILPILIVSYLRSENLESILKSVIGKATQVFVFIDRAGPEQFLQNEKVFLTAQKFSTKFDLSINWVEHPMGVGHGVPSAINWALQHVDRLIVLEDDCLPNEFAIEYFNRISAKAFQDKNVMLISGSTPPLNFSLEKSIVIKYPLIWGWVVDKENWDGFSRFRNSKIPLSMICRALISKPLNILPICYFTAAEIKIRRGKLQAWDCTLALYMLIHHKFGVIPNISTIANLGSDEFASHTFKSDGDSRLSSFGDRMPNVLIDYGRNHSHSVENIIEKEVYLMKRRQIFSPLKALLVGRN
jgi:hypothetical protein